MWKQSLSILQEQPLQMPCLIHQSWGGGTMFTMVCIWDVPKRPCLEVLVPSLIWGEVGGNFQRWWLVAGFGALGTCLRKTGDYTPCSFSFIPGREGNSVLCHTFPPCCHYRHKGNDVYQSCTGNSKLWDNVNFYSFLRQVKLEYNCIIFSLLFALQPFPYTFLLSKSWLLFL